MVDVLIEGSDGLDEEIGFTLNEDMIIQTFPFSAVVPAALEARNNLLLQTENRTGADFFYLYILLVLMEWKWDHFYPVSFLRYFIISIASRKRLQIHSAVCCSREALRLLRCFCPFSLTLGFWSREN